MATFAVTVTCALTVLVCPLEKPMTSEFWGVNQEHCVDGVNEIIKKSGREPREFVVKCEKSKAPNNR